MVRLKYEGVTQSGKEVKGFVNVKPTRMKAKMKAIGNILHKRYPKSELPLKHFKLER